ncbi:hypothetical protein Taro_018235 [Colocasia esculenta]|uniref:Uncharacterized protein n=1 Tax=Colocasia esculenta TaxID=4460 RepID=A0A843UQ77_COLES|nr:hypothetical protein [Colocasia esculenta]
MVSTQHLSIKGKKVDALSGQVDTGSCSQNSSFQNWGQQVDTASEQVDTGPCSQNILLHLPPEQLFFIRLSFQLHLLLIFLGQAEWSLSFLVSGRPPHYDLRGCQVPYRDHSQRVHKNLDRSGTTAFEVCSKRRPAKLKQKLDVLLDGPQAIPEPFDMAEEKCP